MPEAIGIVLLTIAVVGVLAVFMAAVRALGR